jgi:3-hydroxybutyryl-CoA dehydrogenase
VSAALKVDKLADRVVVTLDRPEVRNAIDQQMVDELHAVCAALEADPRVLLVVGSGGVFAAGADIAQLRERGRAEALRGINSSVFDRLRRLPMPVIGLLDGFALGGGAELAYACDLRIGTPRTRIGNPEPGLGILAAAGSTWRLSALVGEPIAKEILLAGRIVDADEALSMRLLSEVVNPEDLLSAGHRLADRVNKQSPLAIRLTKAVFHAPREAHPFVDDLAQAVLFETSDKRERMTAFLDKTERSRHMSLPQQVGVYGGGRMGAGIAHAFLVSGAAVTIVESGDQNAAAARARLESSVAKAKQLGALDESAEAAIARLTVTTAANDLSSCSLVIEAVPEHLPLKQDILARIEAVAPEAWLATNTSSLSVDQLASGLARPENFIGLHFFNPVPASGLVEIVVGSATADALLAAAKGWVVDLGKTAITVTDSPGFASSRLGVAIALEAMRMLEEGVASAEDIDTAMTLGYKHPMGPLRTTDVVGLDVRLAIAEHMAREVGRRFEPPTILREKVAAGELGRKSGRGFYDWT